MTEVLTQPGVFLLNLRPSVPHWRVTEWNRNGADGTLITHFLSQREAVEYFDDLAFEPGRAATLVDTDDFVLAIR